MDSPNAQSMPPQKTYDLDKTLKSMASKEEKLIGFGNLSGSVNWSLFISGTPIPVNTLNNINRFRATP